MRHSHMRLLTDCLWLLSGSRDRVEELHRDRVAHKAKTFTADPFTEEVCQPPDESHKLRCITASLTLTVFTHINGN